MSLQGRPEAQDRRAEREGRSATRSPLLEVDDLTAGYGPLRVLHGIGLSVAEGEVCVILGANGAGKTTALRALSGLLERQGSIRFDGQPIQQLGADAIARLGLGHVPQGRGTFRDLSVADNLAVGAVRRRDIAQVRLDRDELLALFPRLGERLTQLAGHLSGGEQQMLAIARALMARPRLLLLDEPSLGLSPRIVGEVFEALHRLQRERSLTMLIVEQNASVSLELADRGYVLESGEIVSSGTSAALASNSAIRRAYLGV